MENYGIKLDFEDYKTAFKKKGYGIVYNTEEFPIKKFEEIVLKKFKKYLYYTDSVMINLKINGNTLISELQDVVEQLIDYAILDKTLIGYEFHDDILVGNCEVELLITGLDNAVILMANLLS